MKLALTRSNGLGLGASGVGFRMLRNDLVV
jgi:hypothetical protein